jgi:predicted outer membrane repeat protein
MFYRRPKFIAFFIAAIGLIAAFSLLSQPFDAQQSDGLPLPLPSTRDATVGTGTPASCTEAALDAALAIGGVIRFNCGPAMHTITLTTTKVYGTGLPAATLDGANRITLSGGGEIRLFRLYPAADLTLLNIVIADGFDSIDGGAILTQGLLNIFGSTFRNNGVGTRSGGGIFITEGGTANILSSSFIANSATERGGAIYVRENATLNIANSTFANNTGQLGGAIRVYGPNALANVTNVTFNGNNASTDGSTLGAENGGVINLRNSILANPVHSAHCVGTITDRTGNVVTGTGCTGITPVSTGNPLFGALTGNPVYFPIAPGSSAFNKAANCTYLSSGSNSFFANGSPVLRDQRGSERPQDGGCDSGSYEIVLNPTPTPSKTRTPTGTAVPPTITGTPKPPTATFTPAPPTLTPTITSTGIPYVELISNGGFEAKAQGQPETLGWNVKSPKGDKVKCNKAQKLVSRTGECAFKFKGSEQENTKLIQKLTPTNVKFFNGDQLIFRSYVKAINPTTAGKIKVVVRYTDSTPKGKIQLMLIQTSAYTEYKGSYVVLSPNVQKIKVLIGHNSTSGKAYIDDVSLVKTLLISRDADLLPLP